MARNGSPVDGGSAAWIVPLAAPGLPRDSAVDGRRFLGRAVRFARELRLAGLATDLGAAIDFSRALGVVEIGVYNAVFARFWRARGSRLPTQDGPLPVQPPRDEAQDEDQAGGPADDAHSQEIRESTPEGSPRSVDDGEDEDDDGAVDGLAVSELAYGQGEVDRHQQFDRMSAAELREAERLIDLLLPNLERRRT